MSQVDLPRGRSTSVTELRRRADWIRLQTIKLTEAAGSGHYASTFSCAEVSRLEVDKSAVRTTMSWPASTRSASSSPATKDRRPGNDVVTFHDGRDLLMTAVRIAKLGINDQYVLVAPPTHLYRHYGLTAAGVVAALRELLGHDGE